MSDIEAQEKLVFWGYLIQWSILLMPPVVLVSLIYLLVVRNRVANPDLHSHVRWQLATSIVAIVMVPFGFLRLFP